MTKKHTPGWKAYDLDHHAQAIVLKFRDQKNVLNESHKMRMTVAYGLERFWGEHLRLQPKGEDKRKYSKKDWENANKSEYWRTVWEKVYEILHNDAGLDNFPKGDVLSCGKKEQTKKIEEVVNSIWGMSLEDQRIALMVLTQFCDSLVWWTQRYKGAKDDED